MITGKVEAFIRGFRGELSNLKITFFVLLCRFRFPSVMKRLHVKYEHGEKLRVYFVVTDPAKWKCQTVYDKMRSSSVFEPVIAIMMNNWSNLNCREFSRKDFQACCTYFSSKGMAYEAFFDLKTETLLPLTAARPDIVFFQQPWYSVKGSMPLDMNRTALTCYVPYFVANYVDTYYDCCRVQHRFFHRHFILSEQLAEVYRKATVGRAYVGKFAVTGHPALDGICFVNGGLGQGEQLVIYAPHWSLKNCGTDTPFHYATFSWSGLEMLEYARSHPEVKWAFKPHPLLRKALVGSGLMTETEVDQYYSSWGKIGVVSEVAGYEVLFNNSRALITDCGSFLTEYAVTGKPIIHLVNSCSMALRKKSPFASLYATYYQVGDIFELQTALKLVVENFQDPRCTERLSELMSCRLSGGSAAENIVQYLKGMLSGEM